MPLQEFILQRYFEIYEEPTLKFIAEDTGIQITRVFRLLNGSKMKLIEYEKFTNSLRKQAWREQSENDFLDLARSCFLGLSENSIKELMTFMDRKVRLKALEREKQPFMESEIS